MLLVYCLFSINANSGSMNSIIMYMVTDSKQGGMKEDDNTSEEICSIVYIHG